MSVNSNMSWLKLLLVTILSLQLSTCVLAQSNVTNEAQESLALLRTQLERNLQKLPAACLGLWSSYKNMAWKELTQRVEKDVTNFNLTVRNISEIAANVDRGRECIPVLSNSSSINSSVFSSEEIAFNYIYNMALTDHHNIQDQYDILNTEFIANCVEAQRNCEATSRAVTAEVDRLLPRAKRIVLDAVTEIYVLGYQLGVTSEEIHTGMMETYNKAIQNATFCVVIKIQNSKQNEPPVVPSGPLSDLFEEFVTTTESARSSALIDTLTRQQEVIRQNTEDYLDYYYHISMVFYRLGNAIHSFTDMAQEYKVTLNCTSFMTQSVNDAPYERLIKEFNTLEDTLNRDFDEEVQKINDIVRVIQSIELEVQGCASESCDYLAEKIVSKQIEVPWRLQQAANSTTLLLQQTVTAVRESGARVVSDLAEQLKVALVDFKSCVQSYF